MLSSFLSLPFSPGGALFGTIRGGLGIFSKNTKKDKKAVACASTRNDIKGMTRENDNRNQPQKKDIKMSTHTLPKNVTVDDLEKALETIKKLHDANYIMWFVSDSANKAMLGEVVNGLEGAIKMENNGA